MVHSILPHERVDHRLSEVISGSVPGTQEMIGMGKKATALIGNHLDMFWSCFQIENVTVLVRHDVVSIDPQRC